MTLTPSSKPFPGSEVDAEGAAAIRGIFEGIVHPGILFEELGFRYIGPISGHRFDHLLENMVNLRRLQGPILLHVLTSKGKGYKPAEQDPITFHGTGPFDVPTGRALKTEVAAPSYTEGICLDAAETGPG